MGKKANIKKKEKYRATIILKEEIIAIKFDRQGLALETVASMRKLYPSIFVGGAIEEKRRKWEVIRTLGAAVKK